MNEALIGPLAQNRTSESTEAPINPREFLDAVGRSYENLLIWPSKFQPTYWSELWPDQPMRSSIYAAAYEDQAKEGQAYTIELMHQSAVLVEQGSCVFVPASSANIIASLGFSRCVAYSYRTDKGLFFAHITEHDETLFKLRERLFRLYGTGIEHIYLPELQANQSDEISVKTRSDLGEFKESLHDRGIGITPYPWSDFPTASDSKEYSSGIIITPKKSYIVPLIVQEADSNGYPIYQLDSQKDVTFL